MESIAKEKSRRPGDQTVFQRQIASPLGTLLLVGDRNSLLGIYFEKHHPAPKWKASSASEHAIFVQAERELAEYFEGKRTTFQIEFAFRGTPFQERVWAAIAAIPHGQTTTYGEIATEIGAQNAARAVGAATGRNPLSIVVPCHRVLGGNQKLTGYAGGLYRKRWLLNHESAADTTRK